MQKAALLIALASLAAMAGIAHAEGTGRTPVVLLAGATLSARVAHLESNRIDAEVVRPEKTEDAWDKMAAQYAGCHVSGVEQGHPTANRSYFKFDTLACQGRHPVRVPLEALAVSTQDQMIGLRGTPVVDTPLTILVLKTAKIQ